MFRGAFTALVTPFASDGSVDEHALERLVQHQLNGGIDGLALFDITGGETGLSLEERRLVLEIVQRETEGHCFTMAGAFAAETSNAIEIAVEMDWVGVDGILAAAPQDAKADRGALVEHFRRLADVVQTPVIVSNVPGRTETVLDPETLAALAEHDNIRGLYDASGDLELLSSVLASADERFTVLSGDDETTLSATSLGVEGAISNVSNVVPRHWTRLIDNALHGLTEQARALHDELSPLMSETRTVAAVKAALAMMGLADEHCRLPHAPINDTRRAAVAHALAELELTGKST